MSQYLQNYLNPIGQHGDEPQARDEDKARE
jgi:hypothetical protein